MNGAKKKVLPLTVSKQWFDMIVAGEKTEEYREIKPYWIKRLTTNCEVAYDVAAETYCGKVLYRPYTHVLFINGYRKDSPRIEKKIESITIGKPQSGMCPDEWLCKNVFIIKFKRMMNKEFFNAYRGEPVLYKGKDIGAYVAGYVEEKYIILGFYDNKGCILAFNTDVNVDEVYESYRFAKLKYLEVVKH